MRMLSKKLIWELTIVWWRERMTSGKETTVLCLNQMNLRLETSLLALPQGDGERETTGIRKWLWAVWERRSPARLILSSQRLICSPRFPTQCALLQRQQGVPSYGTAWVLDMLSSQVWRGQADGEKWSFSVVCNAGRGGFCPGLKT